MNEMFKPPVGGGVPPQNQMNPSSATEPFMQAGQIWRSGHYLVMEKWATLPPFCIKTNQPSENSRLKQRLNWHPSWLYLLILVGVLAYAIVAACMRQTAAIEIGLIPAKKRFRTIMLTLCTLFLLLSIGMFVGFVMYLDTNPSPNDMMPLFLVLGAFGLFFLSLIGFCIFPRVVHPKCITQNLVVLKGVHPDYLDRFPHWPYAPEW